MSFFETPYLLTPYGTRRNDSSNGHEHLRDWEDNFTILHPLWMGVTAQRVLTPDGKSPTHPKDWDFILR